LGLLMLKLTRHQATMMSCRILAGWIRQIDRLPGQSLLSLSQTDQDLSSHKEHDDSCVGEEVPQTRLTWSS
jgi:hypothetical protein